MKQTKRQTSSSDQAAKSKGAKIFSIAGPSQVNTIPSLDGRGWHYFFGKPVDTGGDDRQILCQDYQCSWVDNNRNMELQQGHHWTWERVNCDNGTETWRVLRQDIFEEEEVVDEDPPMAWDTPKLLESAPQADVFANTVKYIMERHGFSEETAYKIVFSTSRD